MKERTRRVITGVELLTVVLSTMASVLPLGDALAFDRSSTESIDPKSVYVLAVGCCVPWREDIQYCEKNTRQFADALVKSARIPGTNIKVILDKDATYSGFEQGMKWLEKITSPQSTALIYYLGHGGLIPHIEGDRGIGWDEYFVLWSEEKPRTQWYAINTKMWLRDDRFNELLERVPANRKLVIVDSCHLGIVIKPPPGENRKDKTGLIAAARRYESATYTPDKADVLFTYELLRAINNGAADLKEAFEISRAHVTAVSREVISARKAEIAAWEEDEAEKAQWLKELQADQQTPQLIDPHGITGMIRFIK